MELVSGAKYINELSADLKLIFCSVTCSEKEVMVGPHAIVPVEFEATTRALVVSACPSRASIRTSGFAVVSC